MKAACVLLRSLLGNRWKTNPIFLSREAIWNRVTREKERTHLRKDNRVSRVFPSGFSAPAPERSFLLIHYLYLLPQK